MFTVVIISAASLGGLGLLLAGGLLVAAKKFAVYEDPRIEVVSDLLSGANGSIQQLCVVSPTIPL